MVSPKFQSSGELIADRRFEWARDCESKGDLAGAADLVEQTLEIVPRYASAWFMLGTLREKLGNRSGAIAAYDMARQHDPHDTLGAALMLMRLGAAPTAEMPQAYVRELFDQYAPVFDRALTQKLAYRAPEMLRDAVGNVCAGHGWPMRFGSVLDLGCGTGLAGECFRSLADRLVGVDLSAGMIAEARRKGRYDRLAVGDMVPFLSDEADANVRYHLVLAADVFVYTADLTPVVMSAARVLASGGLLAFTVETHDGEGTILGETLRYAHRDAQVRSALTSGGLDLIHLEAVSTRTENGQPVPGLLAVAASPSPRSQT
jgi:predicted TPR repeat methyltransferase